MKLKYGLLLSGALISLPTASFAGKTIIKDLETEDRSRVHYFRGKVDAIWRKSYVYTSSFKSKAEDLNGAVNQYQIPMTIESPEGVLDAIGVMVGPHHILTLARNLINPETQVWAKRVSCHFEGEDSIVSGVRIYTFRDWVEQGNAEYDLALVTLTQSSGYDFGWCGLLYGKEEDLRIEEFVHNQSGTFLHKWGKQHVVGLNGFENANLPRKEFKVQLTEEKFLRLRKWLSNTFQMRKTENNDDGVRQDNQMSHLTGIRIELEKIRNGLSQVPNSFREQISQIDYKNVCRAGFGYLLGILLALLLSKLINPNIFRVDKSNYSSRTFDEQLTLNDDYKPFYHMIYPNPLWRMKEQINRNNNFKNSRYRSL